jgi:hypothetical protein
MSHGVSDDRVNPPRRFPLPPLSGIEDGGAVGDRPADIFLTIVFVEWNEGSKGIGRECSLELSRAVRGRSPSTGRGLKRLKLTDRMD